MFSFLRRKPKFTVRVKDYEQDKLVAGMSVTTSKNRLQKDVSSLQKRFQNKRDKLEHLSNHSGMIVVYRQPDDKGYFSYFVGDLVDSCQQDENFEVVTLPAGKYAHISVDFKVPSDLTLAVAKAKYFFFHKWLPDSGYQVIGDIESIELYDRRSNIGLPSMDLIFPVESIQK